MTRLEAGRWDVLVVGGGITGVAVARDAALRGLKVALIEREDFSFGTSSRSSRLIHGGLRYLKSLDFSLVREGLVERRRLLDLAPGLVRPAPFLYPVYRGDPDPVWRVALGVRLYDALAFGYGLGDTRSFNRQALVREVPGLRRDDLLGGVGYLDAATHDTRLTLAVALAAERAGARLLSRCGAVRLLEAGDEVGGALVEDRLAERQFEVKAKATILCCGPWQKLYQTAAVKLRTARGTHLSLSGRRISLDRFIALRSPRDGRLAFAMPVERYVVLGTTDSDDSRRPGEARATLSDSEYLLELANHAFPAADVGRTDITGAWAGLRPLVADGSGDDADELSRRHTIAAGAPGVWILTGGKLTTHRRMAEDMLDEIEPFLRKHGRKPGPCRTAREPLLSGSLERGRSRLAELGVPAETIAELLTLYGARLDALADRAAAKRAPREAVGRAVRGAQLEMAIEDEWALSVDDVLMRRVGPGQLDLLMSWERAAETAEQMGALLGWSRDEIDRECAQYCTGVERDLAAAGAPVPGEP